MEFRTYTPAEPLRGFVQRFWHSSGPPPDAGPRILPSGTMELVINLREDVIPILDPSRGREPHRVRGAAVAGAYSRYFDPQPLDTVMGVHFRPGGAMPFLGIPSGELADGHFDLDSILGREARELRERLGEAATPQARFSLLETALLERLRRSPERHPALPAALSALARADQGFTVRDLAEEIGLSQRRLIQVFTSAVGLTPKRYQRVCRFQRVRELIRHSASLEWAEIALECGYFDQSHMIHDFQQFTGFSPAEFKRVQGEAPTPSNIARALK